MGIVLLGYRGCGKTSVGRQLANQYKMRFTDTDDLIVNAAKKSIREIFETDGEAKFREMETTALRAACSGDFGVVSLGGGAVLSDFNRQLLKDLPIQRIYLRCDATELHRRIDSDPRSIANRPHLTSHAGTLQEIVELLKIREPLYRDVMTREIDVTHRSIDAVVTLVADELDRSGEMNR